MEENIPVKLLFIFLLLVAITSCFKETDVPVNADFCIEIVNNDYSVPVVVRISNKTVGADIFQWSFEKGKPATSNKITPEEILYETPGVYTIRLEAWNSTEHKIKEQTILLDSALLVGFNYTVRINNYAPVEIELSNYSNGGKSYQWFFEGGEPSASDQKTPPVVTFRELGKHVVKLRVSNMREVIEYTDTICVLPALSVNFDWQPDPGHLDMQAPFIAKLSAHCVSANSYLWEVEGGVVKNDTFPDTEVFFEQPGKYTVVLRATNQKETKSVTKEITILEKSNLYTLENLSLGITTALNTVGCFYSSESRTILRANEVTAENGPSIDFVFWGLGEDLRQGCFISPDSAALKAFPDIPGARHTWLINHSAFFEVSHFDAMINDELLKTILIKENSDQNMNIYFTGEMLPHIILFETEDGRKGAIKVKELVKEGRLSYIIADIKIQKD